MRAPLSISLLVLAATGLASCGGSSTPSGTPNHLPSGFTGMSASAITTRSLAAAAAASSLHYTYDASGNGSRAQDHQIAGRTAGMQVVHQNADVITVLFVGGVVYEKCNAIAMEQQFGAKTRRYAEQWIAFRPGSTLYQRLSSGVLLSAVVQQLTPHHTTFHVKGTATVQGQRVVVLADTITNNNVTYTVNFDLSATAPYLPVAALATGTVSGKPVKSSTYFSQWNAPVHLTAPTSTIPSTLVIK